MGLTGDANNVRWLLAWNTARVRILAWPCMTQVRRETGGKLPGSHTCIQIVRIAVDIDGSLERLQLE